MVAAIGSAAAILPKWPHFSLPPTPLCVIEDAMKDPEESGILSSSKVHNLTDDRKGAWSLTVTANKPLTFRIDTTERETYDVNSENCQ